MANTIILKKSSTASAVPGAGSLQPGELAVNLADAKLYTKTTGGTVILVGSGASGGGAGTVTSVDVSGGTTGLTTSGGPVTSSGTITLAGTLGVANGGTGATTLSSGYLLKGNGTSAVSASVVYDTGTNVGIGTASPASKLDIATGDLRFSSTAQRILGDFSNATETNRLLFQSATTNGNTNVNAIPNGTSVTAAIGVMNNADPTNTGRLSMVINSTETSFRSAINGTGTYLPMTFYSGGLERIRLDTSGNLLIGTTTPAAKLAISGGNGIYVSGSGAAGYNVAQFVNDSAITLSVGVSGSTAGGWTTNLAHLGTVSSSPLAFGTNSTERMRITSSTGNVMVGTTTDYGGRLTLIPATTSSTFAGGNTLQIGEQTNNTAYRLQMGYINHSVAGYVGSIQSYAGGAGNNLILQGDGGNVGINTSAPGAKLETFNDVGGVNALRLNTNFASGNYVDINPYISGVSNGGFSISLNGTIRQVISYTGDVGIGTSSPTVKLDVVGNVLAREDNAGGANPVLIRNSNTGNNTTKSSSALFQGTDTVGTVKSIGSVGFFPDDVNYIGANLRFLVRSGDAAPTERMRILSTGAVGINTSTPATTLEVYGGLIAGSENRQTHPNASAAGGFKAQWNFSGGSAETDLYNLYNGAASSFRFYQSTGSGTAQLLYNMQPNSHEFYISGGEAMRLNSNGQLLIGTTTAVQTLTIGSGSSTSSGINLRTTQTDFVISPSNTAAGGVTIGTSWVSGGQGPLIFTTSAGEILRFNNGSIVSPSLADAVGYKGLPQNSQTASYTLALDDMGKMVNTTTGGVVIPANASVAFPIGSTVVVYNNSASSQTISITTDTIYLAGTATTGSRTLAQRGLATCVKVASTTWVVSGAGVT